MSVDRRVDKQCVWYLHTVEYYSALERKEILTYAATWMNLEDVILSKVSQSQQKTTV